MKLNMLNEMLAERQSDNHLKYIYSCDSSRLPYYYDRMTRLLERFEHFAPELCCGDFFCAPGRVEITGNHIYHQHGCALGAAIDLDMLAIASSNGTNIVHIDSEGYSPIDINMSMLDPIPGEGSTPTALVRGVAAYLASKGFRTGGFTACITSDVPISSGLSSSAALETLIGTMLSYLFNGGSIPAQDIALAGQYAETQYAGKPSRLLDQTSSAFGGIVLMDFSRRKSPVADNLNIDLGLQGLTMCVINTGHEAADLSADHSAIVEELHAVAQYFGKQLLGEVNERRFNDSIFDLREAVGDRAVLRAMHYFSETQRAVDEAQALRDANIDRFLKLVNESGRSSENCLQNIFSTGHPRRQGISFALELTRRILDGKGAYRVHGGGFDGSIQAYVPSVIFESFKADIEAYFGAGACVPLSIRPVGGVKL